MKILKWLVLCLVLAMSVSAIDFPGPFAGKSNLAIVVADNAPADDVIAGVDIANAFGPSVSLQTTKLASEVDDITRYNSILIGSPCYHSIINQLVGYPENCQMSGMRLIRHSNGNVALLVMGVTPAEIRQNARNWVSGVASTECTDSDGGVVPDKAGVVKIPNSKDIREQADKCYKPDSISSSGLPSGGMQVESCSKDELCYVNEAFCSKPSGQNYAVGIKYLKCPDGCSAGACVQTPPAFSAETKLCNRVSLGQTVKVASGTVYDIGLVYVDGNNAKFSVNGEITDLMGVGASTQLADFSDLTVRSVSGNVVEFCISIVPKVGNLNAFGNALKKSQSKTLTFLNVQYNVKLLEIERTGAVFEVNGQMVKLDNMKLGGKTREKISNVADFVIGHIIEYNGELYADFGIGEPVTSLPTPPVPETYQTCRSKYEDKAREYETWRQNYPEGERIRAEGLRVCGEKFSRPVPPVPADIPSERIETVEYKKCMKLLNEFKQELVDKYTLRNIPIPADVMKDYEKRSDRCLLLAGWTSPGPTVVPVPAVEPLPVETSCVGCKRDSMCLQFGIRLVDGNGKPVYCDFDSFFKPQKQLGENCQNNYECMSNTCSEKCISVTERIEAVERELKEQRSLIEKILDFFKRLF